MDNEKNSPASMAKVMKWVPVVLGVVCLLLALVALMVKMEDEATKTSMLLFGAFGVIGVSIMVFGLGVSSMFETMGKVQELVTPPPSDEDMLP